MVDENHPLKDDPATTVPEEPTVLGKYTVVAGTDEDEGDGISAITLSLGGVDGGLFSLTDTDALGGADGDDVYELGFRESPNYESPADADGNNKYHVTIITADNEGATSERALVIEVMNKNEDGKVTLSTTQPAVGQPITATLTDPDMKIVEVEWQWERSELPTTGFIDIRGATSDTYTPLMTVEDDEVTSENEGVDGDEGKYLRVTVTYADNASDDEDDSTVSPPKVRTRTIEQPSENAVREAPDVNQAPEFESGITREVPEDAGDGGKVGAPVRATDPDDDALTYTISGGADMGAFEIGSTSGQITVKKGTDLDFEGGQTTYVVEVTADDPFGLSASTMVTITVTDVNEAPELMLVPPVEITGDADVDYEENGTGDVATYTSTGTDWSLSGDDAGLFDITGGVLTFVSPPDFEAPADADTDNAYEVTVVVSDSDGTDTASMAVTVTVTDKLEIAGEAAVDYEENGTEDVATYTSAGDMWSLSGDDAGLFDITGGVLTFMSPPDFEAPADADTDNAYEVTVVVSDERHDAMLLRDRDRDQRAGDRDNGRSRCRLRGERHGRRRDLHVHRRHVVTVR